MIVQLPSTNDHESQVIFLIGPSARYRVLRSFIERRVNDGY